jgi:dTDP-D-glucose 4,6-dehydratase
MSYPYTKRGVQRRYKMTNFIYRLVNNLEGDNADIERSRLRYMYDLHRHDIKINLENKKLKQLFDKIGQCLIERGFEKTVEKTYQNHYSKNGLNISLSVERYLDDTSSISVFIT